MTTVEVTREKIVQAQRELFGSHGVLLNTNGIIQVVDGSVAVSERLVDENFSSPASMDNLRRAVRIVRLMWYHSRRASRDSSYGQKHELEMVRNGLLSGESYYISNGEFILAMLLCGFRVHHVGDRGNPNCVFAVSSSDEYKAYLKYKEDRTGGVRGGIPMLVRRGFADFIKHSEEIE